MLGVEGAARGSRLETLWIGEEARAFTIIGFSPASG
jgi:hypothetical protein